MKWEWLESALSDAELEQLYEYLNRASFDKDENRYYIVNTKISYSNEVLEILKRKGYKEPLKPSKITKDQLLEKLYELSCLEDAELAHIESVEALLDYINDDAINDAFSDVPLYFE